MSVRLFTAWLRRNLNLPDKRVSQDDRHLKVHPKASGNYHVGLQPTDAVEANSVGCQCQREVGADRPDLSETVHQPYGNAIRVCRIHRVPFVPGLYGFVGQGGSSCELHRISFLQQQCNEPIDPDALRNVNVFREPR